MLISLRNNGVMGCVGIGVHRQARLADWAERRGARTLFDDSGLGLWAIGAPVGGMEMIEAAPVHGVLLGELYAQGAVVPSVADICNAYQGHGQALVWSLLGQFALILWDSERRELALYRDDSSARTLYYRRQDGGGLVFSDRLDILVDSPCAARRPCADTVHEYLRLWDISTPRTIYEGVLSVEPDVLMLYGRHGLQTRDRPVETPLPETTPTLIEAAEELEHRLAVAVERRRSRSADTLVLLSGGVDSAYLCALAAAQAPGRVRAITVGFDGSDLDEASEAMAIAGRLGVVHDVLRFGLDAYQDAFDQLATSTECPFADPAAAATLLSYLHAREHGQIALDGTGADTLLGIMPARHQRLATEYVARLPGWLRRTAVRAIAPVPRLRHYRPLLDFDDPEEVLSRWNGYRRREIETLCGCPVNLRASRFYQIYQAFPAGAHFERYSALFANLPDDRIHSAASLTGLRVRCPFFDPDVQAYVRSLPIMLRWQPGRAKRVLKAGLSRHLPSHCLDRPKHGFDFPFRALLRHRGCRLAREYLMPSRFRGLGLVHERRIRQLRESFIAGDEAEAFRVWGLVVLAAWAERHQI